MSAPPQLSVVIPLCNEEDTLRSLYEKVEDSLGTIPVDNYEVLFIDDGSRDGSWQAIEALQADHPDRIRALRFRRNYGKAAALDAGFAEARGEIILTMDADLQDDPDEIPAFLQKLDEGYDCVSGWKQLRKDPLGKTLPSRVFNWATRIASGVKIHDFNCGFKAYRAEALQDLDLYGELHRYIPVLLHADGYAISEIPVKHHRRTHGVSKYGWKRLIKGFLDLITVIAITRYLKRPGHLFGGFGLLSGMSGFGILAALSIQKLAFGVPIGNRPLFFLGILLLLLGVQLISTGVLGEIIYYHAERKRHSTQFR